MCTKWFSDGDVHKYFNPYESPYEAFINYMNVLSDFIIRLDKFFETHDKLRYTETISVEKAKKEKNSESQKNEWVDLKRTSSKKKKDILKATSLSVVLELTDSDLKKRLKNIKTDTFAIALKGLKKEIKDKILFCLSKSIQKEISIYNLSSITKQEIEESHHILLTNLISK